MTTYRPYLIGLTLVLLGLAFRKLYLAPRRFTADSACALPDTLKKVDGVAEVTAKYEGESDGWAKVTYEDDKTDVEDLTFATEMVGYPSRLKQ